MSAFIRRAGFWGALLFLLLQTVQVVIPILPSGVSCLAGVLIFGPWCGFLYNYLGICAGSMLAFLIARHFGRPLLGRIFRPEQLEIRPVDAVPQAPVPPAGGGGTAFGGDLSKGISGFQKRNRLRK